jgi:hypothetical protein
MLNQPLFALSKQTQTLVLVDALPSVASGDQLNAAQIWLGKALPQAWLAGSATVAPSSDAPRFSMLELWLAQRLGWPGALPLSILMLPGATVQSLNAIASQSVLLARSMAWFAARDHLILREADCPTTQWIALATHVFAESGWQAQALDQQGWFVLSTLPAHGQHKPWQPDSLRVCSSGAALGRNIDRYLPTGPEARSLRVANNLLQMSLASQASELGQSAALANTLWPEAWVVPGKLVEQYQQLQAIVAFDKPCSDHQTDQVLWVPTDPTEALAWWNVLPNRLIGTAIQSVVLLGQQHWVVLNPANKPRGFWQRVFGPSKAPLPINQWWPHL